MFFCDPAFLVDDRAATTGTSCAEVQRHARRVGKAPFNPGMRLLAQGEKQQHKDDEAARRTPKNRQDRVPRPDPATAVPTADDPAPVPPDQENSALPAPPDKTTAPRSVDVTGNPRPVDPSAL